MGFLQVRMRFHFILYIAMFLAYWTLTCATHLLPFTLYCRFYGTHALEGKQ